MPKTSGIYGRVVLPLMYAAKGDFRFAYFNRYKKNLTKSREAIEKYQLWRLQKLVKHAYSTVPYYRDLFDSQGIDPSNIKSLADYRKIPPLTKKIMMKNLHALKSTRRYKLQETVSGGSTGNRIVVFKDKKYEQIEKGVWMRDLYSVGVKPGDKVAWFWGSQLETRELAENTLKVLSLKVNRRIIFNSFNYTDRQLREWLLNDFNRFKPDHIFGYASAIYYVARYVHENKLKIHPVKTIITTAEKLTNRSFIEKVFGCKVIDHYGCREVSTIAIEDMNYVMHSSDDFVLVEVGENNKIMLTTLENYGMPLLRYENGDVADTARYRKTKDASPLRKLSIKIGRISEVFYNPKGERVRASAIGHIIANRKLDIGDYQVIQKSLKLTQLKLVRSSDINPKHVRELKEFIKYLVGCQQIQVSYVKAFPLPESGKRIPYICEVKHEDIDNKL